MSFWESSRGRVAAFGAFLVRYVHVSHQTPKPPRMCQIKLIEQFGLLVVTGESEGNSQSTDFYETGRVLARPVARVLLRKNARVYLAARRLGSYTENYWAERQGIKAVWSSIQSQNPIRSDLVNQPSVNAAVEFNREETKLLYGVLALSRSAWVRDFP
jgi:hypothetical protein